MHLDFLIPETCHLPPDLIQLLVQRPLPRTPRMSADAPEFVVKGVQICAQEPHDLHAEISVFAEKLQELLARNEGCRRLLARFSGDPIPFPAHALAQPEHRSRTDN